MEIEKLSDMAAVNALSQVVAEWSNRRGLEALVVVLQTRHQAAAAFDKSPSWATGAPHASVEAGKFARRMLRVLIEGDDDEVATWTKAKVEAQLDISAHVVDPISLSIIGVIFVGGILAARVKKVGSVEFYEGIPKELADVIKVGTTIAVPPSGK